MKCPNCGYENNVNSNFCQSCGTKIQEENQTNNISNDDSNITTSNKPKKKPYWLVPVGLFLGCIFFMIIATRIKGIPNTDNISDIIELATTLLNAMAITCVSLVIPGIIFAIVKSTKK